MNAFYTFSRVITVDGGLLFGALAYNDKSKGIDYFKYRLLWHLNK